MQVVDQKLLIVQCVPAMLQFMGSYVGYRCIVCWFQLHWENVLQDTCPVLMYSLSMHDFT